MIGALVGAVRDVRRRDQLAHVQEFREINALAVGEDLDGVPIAVLEADRDHVHGIREEVPVGVGQGDSDLAAGGGGAVRGGRVVVVIGRG